MSHMNTMRPSLSVSRSERGITLIVVMVMLLLGSILVLGSTRTTWLNETMVGNDSDYNRAYAAAEALIRDAEADIRGRQLGGQPFNPGNPAFFQGSRRPAAGPFFPLDYDDLDTVLALMPAAPNLPCRAGICVPSGENGLGANWWTNPATLNAMIAVAATYGQFTRPPAPAPALGSGNPILLTNGVPARGWYWVEVFPYAASAAEPRDLPVPDKTNQPFFFRITAIAQGQKPETQVVLRTVFVPRPQSAAI